MIDLVVYFENGTDGKELFRKEKPKYIPSIGDMIQFGPVRYEARYKIFAYKDDLEIMYVGLSK